MLADERAEDIFSLAVVPEAGANGRHVFAGRTAANPLDRSAAAAQKCSKKIPRVPLL